MRKLAVALLAVTITISSLSMVKVLATDSYNGDNTNVAILQSEDEGDVRD